MRGDCSLCCHYHRRKMPPAFFNFLFTYLFLPKCLYIYFLLKCLYFFIISSRFPYFSFLCLYSYNPMLTATYPCRPYIYYLSIISIYRIWVDNVSCVYYGKTHITQFYISYHIVRTWVLFSSFFFLCLSNWQINTLKANTSTITFILKKR